MLNAKTKANKAVGNTALSRTASLPNPDYAASIGLKQLYTGKVHKVVDALVRFELEGKSYNLVVLV